MGFFISSTLANCYFGIWYNNKKNSEFDMSDFIWIANRDNPLDDDSGVLQISENGNLQLLDKKNSIIWSTNISNNNQVNNSVVALLEDTGNLVLLPNVSSGTPIWQSFDFPVNCLVPSLRLTVNYKKQKPILQSWKGIMDPSSGQFTLDIIPRAVPEIFIWNGEKPHWRSGPWNGNLFLNVPFLQSEVVTGFSVIYDHENTIYISYSIANRPLLEHLVLKYDGNLIQKFWDSSMRKWEISWQSIESECDNYGKCGTYGSCNANKSPICSCLKGFEPKYVEEWHKGNWSRGCVRRTPLQCGTIGGKTDGFHTLKHVKLPDHPSWFLERNLDDCKRKCLGNCSCLAYAYYPGKGCMLWNRSLMDIQHHPEFDTDLFIRLAASELGESSKWKIVIAVTVIAGMATFLAICAVGWRWIRQQYGKQNSNNGKLLDNKRNYEVNEAQFQDLPLFKFERLEVATNNFSLSNKLGQGGFGPVYKGILEDGQQIAVKRLSKYSGQGIQEFMNEVVVISKLQHKNLVRLLGCYVEGEEKMLVYEYMPNKSLDAFLFDPSKCKLLDWKKRSNIIHGICRGLLYLHRDSRLKIIHRDLKPSNILLDEELNPKISDFGMARIFGTKQDEENTSRVVGTYGYMSPEYAMDGWFSEKSDVFSFGVLLLEIISGKKNKSFANSEYTTLLTYAWTLWNQNESLSLVDPTIFEPHFEVEILRCIELGLLCVQEHPEDRPNIPSLIMALDGNDVLNFPHPKQPGYTRKKVVSSNDQEQGSINYASITVISGR